jgi:predicted nucleotidyltransferase
LIDADDLRILGHVEQACAQTGVEWMLVGALARDIHLVEIAGIHPLRATNDVDIAVAVESWETFAALKELLIGSRKFVTSKNAQRLLGVDDLDGRQLDIVPFGVGIRDPGSLIRWPPDAAVVMSVAGFEEAFRSSVEHKIGEQLIRLASVPGLASLKLIAWRDRHHETTKDAVDFALLLRAYEHVLGSNELYVVHLDVLEDNGFDPRIASAWLLGAHIRAIAAPTTIEEALRVLDDPRFRDDVLVSSQSDALQVEVLIERCREGLGH